MTEPDRNNHPNLLQMARTYLKQAADKGVPYVQHLHRLDRAVGGVILFVKDKTYLHHLSNQFAQREVEKYYEALTADAPLLPEGELLHWHRKEKKRGVIVPEGTPYAEQARLNFRVESSGDFYRWYIQLHTGKFHQIRVQLAETGCPIIGDVMYGSKVTYKSDAIALYAARLVITHPVSAKRRSFEAGPEF